MFHSVSLTLYEIDTSLLSQRFPVWRGLTVLQLAWVVSKMLHVPYLLVRAPPSNKWYIFPLILLAIDGKVFFGVCKVVLKKGIIPSKRWDLFLTSPLLQAPQADLFHRSFRPVYLGGEYIHIIFIKNSAMMEYNSM